MVTTSSEALMGISPTIKEHAPKPTRAEILANARAAKAAKASQQEAKDKQKETFSEEQKAIWARAYAFAIISSQINHPSKLGMAVSIADQAIADYSNKFQK